MSGKKVEGNEEQKRQKAREASERGHAPSEESATSGASRQRKHLDGGTHGERIDTIREGKQEVIGENTPEARPGSRD